jgi:hypothetical protein
MKTCKERRNDVSNSSSSQRVRRRLEDLTYQDRVSRLAVVIGAIGVVVIGVLLVEALFRLIVLGALGLGGRLWWLHRAIPTAGHKKTW